MNESLVVPAKVISSYGEGDPCFVEGRLAPCTIIIIGASGDLTRRKIIPALFCLYLYGILPSSCRIVGCARTQMDDEQFRDNMQRALKGTPHYHRENWPSFARMLHYHQINYSDKTTFLSLGRRLREIQEESGSAGKLFYLAIPPSLYETVVTVLGRADLIEEGPSPSQWSRVVVEKPFGRDLRSAMALDKALHRYLAEHQIYRIDHYLAKETVQNILMFRFANAIFEPIWNRRYIESVKIAAFETLGVEHRAGYYEQAGVLRDMFQNHMMQLLALTAMEPPAQFEADRVRDEKVKVYRALRPFPIDRLNSYLVLGQYDRGTVGPQQVVAYREEPGVSPNSLTPTFAAMKVFVDNWRWQGVPFYIASGKRLAEKITRIEILFKHVPHSMFRNVLDTNIEANKLILGIYPDEEITLTFQTKTPGARVCLRSVKMDFHYHEGYQGPKLEAYEKVLLDCIMGDHMLFWRQDGVELCWAFLTPILEECESCKDRPRRLHPYPAGSWGPEQARAWIPLQ